MLTISTIQGKTVKQWAEADLPYGAFTEMVREIDPCYGIYAEAGASKKKFCVINEDPDEEDLDDEVEVEAFNELHARAVAWDEYHWHPRHTIALPADDDAGTIA